MPCVVSGSGGKGRVGPQAELADPGLDHYNEAVEEGEEVQTSIGQLRLTHDDEMTVLRQKYERKVSQLLSRALESPEFLSLFQSCVTVSNLGQIN